MSTILFNIVFNLLYEWLKNCDAPPYVLADGLTLREAFFADDVSFTTPRPKDNQKLLDCTDEFLEWTDCMQAKPIKCKDMALAQFKPGCVHQYVPHTDLVYSPFDPKLYISNAALTFIADSPFKFLGRKIYVHLTEHAQLKETADTLVTMLTMVDALLLSGPMKLWLYNFGVVPRLSWPLLVYDFPITAVEDLDATANRFIKNWSQLPLHGPNPVILYLPRREKGLGIIKLVHYYQNLALVREHLLKYSSDPHIQELAKRRLKRAQQNGQKKWTAPVALLEAERGLVLDAMTAEGQTTKAGIGFGRKRDGRKVIVGSSEHRVAVKLWAKEQTVKDQLVTLMRLTVQQDWTQWEGVLAQDLTWNRLLYRMSNADLKFYLQGTLQIAPSPKYLKRLGYIQNDVCPLCHQKGGSFYHIMSLCKVALEQGRYTWRHNEILRLLHFEVGSFVRKRSRLRPCPIPKVQYVKAGEKPSAASTRAPALLTRANDWKMLVDLPNTGTYLFPAHIAVTGKKPDFVLWSMQLKLIVILELTVPSERNVRTANLRKRTKYGEAGGLVDQCKLAGYKVELLCVEVGVLGFVADSMSYALKKLGVWSTAVSTQMSEIALRCSYAIFVQRGTLAWKDWRMYVPQGKRIAAI